MLFYTGKCTGNVIFRLRKVLPSDSSGKFMSPLTRKVLREVIGEPMYHLWIYFFGLALLVQPFKKWKASSNSLIAETIYWEVLGGKPTCMCEQRSLIHTNTGHKSNERERESNWSSFEERCLSCLHKWTSDFGLNAMHDWNIPSPLKSSNILHFLHPHFMLKCVCEREIARPPTQISKRVSFICRTMKRKKKSNNIQSN